MALLEQEHIADHSRTEPTTAPPPQSPRRKAPPRWLLGVPLLLLTFWLGARGLNADAIWYDEWLSIYYAGGADYGGLNLVRTWAEVARISTWPPGFQSALAGWVALTGSNQAALRLFPLLLGLLAVAWMYRLGRDMGSPLVGLTAAAALGGSAFFIYYLHELRAYTLYVLCVVVMVWAYWRMLAGKTDLPTQLAFVFSVGASLYVHYFAALAAPGLAVYHLLFVRKNRDWWRVPFLIAMGTLLFLPWWIVAFKHASDAFTSEIRRIVPLGWFDITQTLLYSFSNGGVLLFALLTIYALRFGKTDPRRDAVRLTWVWLLVAVVTGLLLNERLRVIFHVRHLVVAFPALALLMGFGLEALTQRQAFTAVWTSRIKFAALVVGLWLAAGVYHSLDGAFAHEQPGAEPTIPWAALSPVLERLRTQGDADDRVFFHLESPGREWLTEPVVDFYMRDMGVDDFTQLEEIRGLEADDDYFRQSLGWLEGAARVWMAIMPDVPSTYHVREFQRALAENFIDCGALVDQAGMQLNLYVQRRDATNRMDFVFGSGRDIRARQLGDLSVLNGRVLALFGVWVDDDLPLNTYSFGLHIDNAAGELVAQSDLSLADYVPYRCAMREIDISALPPGEYTLRLLAYNPATGERLEGRDIRESEAKEGDRLAVATFTLE